MRFPMFSSDHFTMPQHQFYGCGPGTGRRGCSGASRMPPRSPFSFPADAAAAFIPVMMMGARNNQTRRPPCGPHHHHGSAGPSTHQRPPFCFSDCLSQPVISDAINVAQDLLGELLGQPTCSPADAQRGGHAESRKPSSPCSSQGKRCSETTTASGPKTSHTSTCAAGKKPSCSSQRKCYGETPTASCPKTSHTHKTSSPENSDTAKETPSPQTLDMAQKPSEKRSEKTEVPSPTATQMTQQQSSVETPVSRHPWNHTLLLPGFSPSEVSIKVRNSQLYVHAVHEEAYGKLKVTRVVILPENIDQKTVTCAMNQSGVLVLQASFKDNADMKNKEEDTGMSADKEEREDPVADGVMKKDPEEPERKETMVHSVEKTEVSEDQEEELSPESKPDDEHFALENKAEHPKALENKAGEKKALEDKSEKMYALENKVKDHQDLENETEQEATEADSVEPTTESAERAECTETENPDITEAAEEEDECVTGEELGEFCQHPVTETLDTQSGELEHDTDMQTAADISCPIIEEPDDESASEEEFTQSKTITRQLSTGDFVVIDENLIKAGDFTSEDGFRGGFNSEDIQANEDQEHEEEAAKDEADRETSTSDETDPTRPIKRTLSSGPHNHDAFHATMPLVGFSPEDVNVSLHGHTLRIVAKRQSWLGEASYTETVEKQLELPGHLDVYTVKCVYEQEAGCLVITAQPQSHQRKVPVVLQ